MVYLLLVLLLVCPAAISQADDPIARIASRRALEFAEAEATESWEKKFYEKIVPEYWHPQGNDSGLPARAPDFIPDAVINYDLQRRTFLTTTITEGRIFSGKSPWTMEGKETVYCVELIYTAVAEITYDKVILYPEARKMSDISAFCVDENDGKLKFVEAYPFAVSFYRIPYFLEAWGKKFGKGSKINLDEVRGPLMKLIQ